MLCTAARCQAAGAVARLPCRAARASAWAYMRRPCTVARMHRLVPASTSTQTPPRPPPPPRAPLPVHLRPYQRECVATCLAALEQGATRIGVSSPTGSGKTTMFTALLAQLPAPSACAGRVLILVNAVALAEQASATVRRLLPHLHVELEQGPQHHASGAADVTVATVQSLRTRLAKYDPGEFKCVVVDEAHHATSPTYRTVLAHFHSDIVAPDALHDQPACARVPIVGFSATFSRHDGTALGTVFESIVYHKDFLAMIEEQWYACLLTHRLCPLRFTAVQAGFDLSDVARSGADYNVTALAKIINTPTINELVVRSWIERAYKQRRATLVFAVNIGHVHALVDEFVRRGIDARAMHSQMPPAMRAEVLEAFRQGAFPVLVNCGTSRAILLGRFPSTAY